MIAAIESYIPVLIAVIGTGGLAGAIVAFVKVKPEANQIAVSASQGALIVQTGVIETLREENDQLRERLEDLESKVAMMGDLREKIQSLEDKNRELERENKRLRSRVAQLELSSHPDE